MSNDQQTPQTNPYVNPYTTETTNPYANRDAIYYPPAHKKQKSAWVKFLIGFIGAVVFISLLAGCGAFMASLGRTGSATSTTTASETIPAPSTKAPLTKKAVVPPALQSPELPETNGLELVGKVIKKDYIGDFTGTLRLRNTTSTPLTGTITITLLKKGNENPVGTLTGFIVDAKPGKITSVSIVTTDDYEKWDSFEMQSLVF